MLADADDLGGMPVVTADLHSALPAILAGIRADAPQARVAYLITDGGALPAWFSRTLAGLRAELAGTVTVGQAFGGDLEATTLHSGLLAARHVLHADVADRGAGAGQPRHRHPVGLLRRRRRRGGQRGRHAGRPAGRLAAHLRRRPPPPAPGRVAPQPHRVRPGGARPGGAGGARRSWTPALAAEVHAALAPLAARHRIVRVPTDGLDAALRASAVPLSTMGRGLDADHAYFLAAAAAGRHAAALLAADPRRPAVSRPRRPPG